MQKRAIPYRESMVSPSMTKRLLRGLSAPEHYAVFNSFAIDFEIIERAVSNNDCSENLKPVFAGYGLIHYGVDYSSQNDEATDNSQCKGYVAFNAITNSHDVFILSDAKLSKKLQSNKKNKR